MTFIITQTVLEGKKGPIVQTVRALEKTGAVLLNLKILSH